MSSPYNRKVPNVYCTDLESSDETSDEDEDVDDTGGSPEDAELRFISESIEQLSDLWQLYMALQTTTFDVSTGKEFFHKWTKIVGETVAKPEMIKLLTTLDISVKSDGEDSTSMSL